MRLPSTVLLLSLTVVLLTGALPQTPPLVTGLDHIIILVNDLEAAAGRYRAMGFALKPGRPHDNGIRNQHVKFEDGTELELLTAPEAKDQLTAQYRRYLAQGDGPRARRTVRAGPRCVWRGGSAAASSEPSATG